MISCFNYSIHQRNQSIKLQTPITGNQSLHFQRWLNSLGKPPVFVRRKFEFVVKISGMRRIQFPGDKVTLNLHSFLSAMENGKIVDYSLCDQSYRVTCKILHIEGPGVNNQDKAAIVIAEIVSNKAQEFYLIPPEHYRKDKNFSLDITLPAFGSILRFLYDPRKTIDPLFGGLLLSYTKRNFIERRITDRKLFCPQKYVEFLEGIQASELSIGRIPKEKLTF